MDDVRHLECCAGKWKYASLGAARRAIRERTFESVVVPYRCEKCGSYHLGSSLYLTTFKRRKGDRHKKLSRKDVEAMLDDDVVC